MPTLPVFDVDTQLRATAVFSIDKVLTDPTAVTFFLKNPGGTIADYVYGTDAEVTKQSTGIYRFRITLTAALGGAGQWYCRVEGTGTAVGAFEKPFTVRVSEF